MQLSHVKACAKSNKLQQKVVQEEAIFYEEHLKKEINEDRIAQGKKLLKGKDNDDDDLSGESDSKPEKEIKVSTTDLDSGWFHKGKHKQVFAYSIETPVINTDGFWDSPSIQETNMTVGHSKGFMTRLRTRN